MAKIKVSDDGIEAPLETTDREKRWKTHVENYAKKNPVKFATKNSRHEFDVIPLTFK